MKFSSTHCVVLSTLGVALLGSSYSYTTQPTAGTSDAISISSTSWHDVITQRNTLGTIIDRTTAALNSHQMKSTNITILLTITQQLRAELLAYPITEQRSFEQLGKAIRINHEIALNLHEALEQHANTVLLNKIAQQPIDKSLITINIDDVTILFMHTQELIATISNQLDTWGASWINKMTQSLQKQLQDVQFRNIAKRTLPYAILGLTFLYINDAQKFEHIPVIKTLKHVIGTLPHYSKEQQYLGLDTIQRTFNPAALLITPIVVEDAKQAAHWLDDKIQSNLAYLQGKSYSSSPIFYSSLKFSDIVGNSHAKEQLETLAHYVIVEKQMRESGCPINKGYLFMGDTQTAQQLAYSFAARVTALLQEQATTKKCGIYEFHASILINKPFEKILTEIETHAGSNPCIILINELDWLFTTDKPDIKVVSEFINQLVKITKPTSKKNLIVIATAATQNIARINPVLLTTPYLGIKITVNIPATDERAELLRTECSKKGLVCSQAYLETLVNKTQGYSQSSLNTLINQAFSLAQLQKQPFATTHIDCALEMQGH